MTDYKLLYRFSPNFFNKISGFPSKTRKISPVNSMEKFKSQQISERQKELSIISSKNKILGENFIQYSYSLQIDENNKIKKLFELKDFQDKKIQKSFNQSAVIIQKIVRGWLIRRKTEEMLIEIRRRITKKVLFDMDNGIGKIIYIGNRVKIASVKIQSIYRGWKFRSINMEKIQGGKKILQGMKLILSFFVCKEMINEKKNNYKSIRLRKIREKLAIMVINQALVKIKETDLKPSKNLRKLPDHILSDEPALTFKFATRKKREKTIIESPSEASDSSNSPDSKGQSPLKFSNVFYDYRPRTVTQGIPILIQKKRPSQIWMELVDNKKRTSVITLKNQSKMPEKQRKSVSPTHFELIPKANPNNHRKSISFTITNDCKSQSPYLKH